MTCLNLHEYVCPPWLISWYGSPQKEQPLNVIISHLNQHQHLWHLDQLLIAFDVFHVLTILGALP